jgi:chromosome condensin MukBEF ATPase and DNA-binding subunit MukB
VEVHGDTGVEGLVLDGLGNLLEANDDAVEALDGDEGRIKTRDGEEDVLANRFGGVIFSEIFEGASGLEPAFSS